MSKQKLLIASLGLTACLCWALSSSMAESQRPGTGTPSSPAPSISDTPLPGLSDADAASHDDAGYLGLFGVARLEDVLPDEGSGPRREIPFVTLPPGAYREGEAFYNGTRGDSQCNNISYRNGLSSIVSIAAIDAETTPLGFFDDCRLLPDEEDRFICSATVKIGGQAAGAGPVMDLTVWVYNDCPEATGTILVDSGTFANIPNDGIAHDVTIDVSPDYYDQDGLLYVGCVSSSDDGIWYIARNTNDPGDEGTTANTMVIPDGNPGCNNTITFGGGTTPGGLAITLRGTKGPLGCCCDTLTAIQTASFASTCGAFTEAWSPTTCMSAPPCNLCSLTTCSIGGPGNLENEPDCTTNYVDVTNRACADRLTFNSATEWTPISSPATGCGRSGTYSFLNGTFIGVDPRRDQDSYLLVLTSDTRVTWKVRAYYPAEALIGFTLRQTNGTGPLSCGLNISTAAGDTSLALAPACEYATASVCLPGRTTNGGFRYILRARPQLTAGIPCGESYQFELTTEPCTFPTSGACCTPTGCIETNPLACLIGFNQYQGDGTTCGGLAVPCVGVPPNDICPTTKVIFSNSTDVTVSFDTTFANTETVTYGGGSGQVFKDVWYEYRVPTLGTVTNGRLAVSTIGTCFNSKVVVLEVRNNLGSQSQTQQCSSGGLQAAVTRGVGTPVVVTTGEPILPITGFTYVKANANVLSSQDPALPAVIRRIKIRVGGTKEDEFGAGTLRISWIPDDQTGGPWNANAGRCCFVGGGCLMTPFANKNAIPPQPNTDPDNCAELGGYITFVTDFQQGNSSTARPEFQAVGCASMPCPVVGEACWNAVDFNAEFPSGFGTITRRTLNKLYVKYTVPAATPLGSAIVIDTCGSNNFFVNLLNTSMQIFRAFNITSGECDGDGNALWGQNDECGPQNATSNGAAGRAECYGAGVASCRCFPVVSSPAFGQVAPGQTYYIEIGAPNTIGGPRFLVDPARNDCRGQGPMTIALAISNPATCFTCVRPACVGTAEGETDCGVNYVDSYNAGCGSFVPAFQLFKPISCGQTYCGSSSTFRVNNICVDGDDCAAGDDCTIPPMAASGTCTSAIDNARDFDYYRYVVTSAGRLSWSISADFPAAIQIVAAPNATSTLLGAPMDTDACFGTVVVNQTVNLEQCSATLTEADVCPGVYYLSVTVATEQGTPCDGQRGYTATLTCSAASIAANSCCKGDMNNDGRINGIDIQLFINELRLPFGNVVKSTGCFDLKTCRADFGRPGQPSNPDYLVNLSGDLSGFVSAMVGKPICPPTNCDDSSACHSVSADDVGVISDMSTGIGGDFRAVDDFKVSSPGAMQQITSVCWWGFYFDFNSVVPCTPSGGSGDSFRISFYSDASGIPGAKLAATITPGVVTKTNTGVDINYLGQKVRRFKYETTLASPINVTNGGCYWIEIVNTSSGACLWLWETSKLGNGLTGQRNGGPAGKENWSQGDLVVNLDQAWCLPGLRIEASDCGLPQGRCCKYPGGICSVTDKNNCEQTIGGVWLQSGNCTGSPPCPVQPDNDACPSATLITANVLYTGSTLFATKDQDSLPMVCERSCNALCNSANDVWFKWVNNDPAFDPMFINGMVPLASATPTPITNPVFSMCDGVAPFTYDSMMVAYSGAGALAADGCPRNGGQAERCNDDFCGGSGPSRLTVTNQPTGSPPFCTVGVDCYRTYYIRISGWQGTNGNFTFKVITGTGT